MSKDVQVHVRISRATIYIIYDTLIELNGYTIRGNQGDM